MISQTGAGDSQADDPLQTAGLFVEFTPAELQELRATVQTGKFAPGDVILGEGKANRALHVLKRGRIRVTQRVENKEVALCDLIAGQTFGELSIIEDGVASATLQAVTDAEVLSIAMHDLARFLQNHPAAAAKFWRAVAVDLRRRLLQTNDVVRNYFEVNRALIENPTFRQAYAMCNK
jgi:CRP/FNR family cyclic AMP-dependent transcriptional regulator